MSRGTDGGSRANRLFVGAAWLLAMALAAAGCGKTEKAPVKEPAKRIEPNPDMPPAFEVAWKKQLTLKGHAQPLQALCFAADGKTLASQDKDGIVKLWDVVQGKELLTLTRKPDEWIHGFAAQGLVVSPGRDSVAFAFRDAATTPERTLTARFRGGLTAGFSHDCRLFLSIGKDQKTLAVLDVATGQRLHALPPFAGLLRQTIFAPNGKDFAVITRADAVRHGEAALWTVAAGTPRFRIPFDDIPLALAYSGDGAVLAVSYAFAVEFLDTTTGKDFVALEEMHRREVLCIAFAPDGATAATGGGEGLAKLWDLATGKKLAAFNLAADSSARIASLAFSPDGHILAAANSDHSLTLWQVDGYHANTK